MVYLTCRRLFRLSMGETALGNLPNERAQLTYDERFQDHPERGLVGGLV
jgi:hypothetical protein